MPWERDFPLLYPPYQEQSQIHILHPISSMVSGYPLLSQPLKVLQSHRTSVPSHSAPSMEELSKTSTQR